eukprot:CAMPEP_0119492962 /NCGR_PEP_ID=MMETSP1344-20130328/17351_1 /TAXON_ID=236787 /ORGANISM="Florenciella parvula, Strain CCMP2471" /LENGTH=276 /DNA_ID=CAMNT_0007528347 /DNA_START=58 /DNA_END=888 /DNA_ORIENTATION=+
MSPRSGKVAPTETHEIDIDEPANGLRDVFDLDSGRRRSFTDPSDDRPHGREERRKRRSRQAVYTPSSLWPSRPGRLRPPSAGNEEDLLGLGADEIGDVAAGSSESSAAEVELRPMHRAVRAPSGDNLALTIDTCNNSQMLDFDAPYPHPHDRALVGGEYDYSADRDNGAPPLSSLPSLKSLRPPTPKQGYGFGPNSVPHPPCGVRPPTPGSPGPTGDYSISFSVAEEHEQPVAGSNPGTTVAADVGRADGACIEEDKAKPEIPLIPPPPRTLGLPR